MLCPLLLPCLSPEQKFFLQGTEEGEDEEEEEEEGEADTGSRWEYI